MITSEKSAGRISSWKVSNFQRLLLMSFIQRGEALAIFKRDLIIHFQQMSKAAAWYVRALLGGVKGALEVYHRVEDTTKRLPMGSPKY